MRKTLRIISNPAIWNNPKKYEQCIKNISCEKGVKLLENYIIYYNSERKRRTRKQITLVKYRDYLANTPPYSILILIHFIEFISFLI